MAAPLHILLIDNEKSFPDSARTFARLNGWNLETPESPDAWQKTDPLPDIVLLDYGLDGQLNAWLDALRTANLLKRTWLISTGSDSRLDFVKKNGLGGFIRKPVDLPSLPDLIETQANAEASQSLTDEDEQAAGNEPPLLISLATQLQPEIDIIDVGDLSVVWNNHAERTDTNKQHPLTAHDWKLVRLLEAELLAAHQKSGHTPASVQRLDWDAAHAPAAFRHTRLYPVGEHYWLTRDWHEGENIHDDELFNLERHASLDDRLNAAALYLARRYGITRLRIYKIAELPHVPEFEDNPGPFVMPVFQRGGGFKGDAVTWRSNGFMMADNPNTAKASAPNYRCIPVQVTNDEPIGCSEIQYGNAGTRAQFPIRDSDNRFRALLAFDRRTDHFNTGDDDAELARLATGLYGVFDGPLTMDDINAMQGLLADLGERLLGWLRDDEHTRERLWHKTISDCLLNTLTQTRRPRDAEPFETLSALCAGLLEAWKKHTISGQVWGLLGSADACPTDARPAPLIGWYIALTLDDDRWQAIAGAGAVYETYAQHGGPLPLLCPQRQALANDNWAPCMIQDFQAWRGRKNADHDGQPPAEYAFLGTTVDSIGSWLGVPMDLGGNERALMVVHSPYRFHFTPMRCRLLADAARRLLPPLVSALQESKTRGAFVGAVMHDVKNDAAAALAHLDAALGGDSADQGESLMMLRHYLEGLVQLGLDFLHVVRPGGATEDRFETDLQLALRDRQSLQARPWIESLLRPWQWVYAERRVVITDNTGATDLTLPAPAWLRQVTRTLLQNAFRHGEGDIDITLSRTTLSDRPALCIDIRNPAYASIAAGVHGAGTSTVVQVGPRAQAGTRLGLTHARRLAKAVGGTLSLTASSDAEAIQSDEDPMQIVNTTLVWPLAADAETTS